MLKRMVVLGMLAVVGLTLTTFIAIGSIMASGSHEPALANGVTGVLSPDESAPPALAGASGVISPGASQPVADNGQTGVLSIEPTGKIAGIDSTSPWNGTLIAGRYRTRAPGKGFQRAELMADVSDNGIGGVLVVNGCGTDVPQPAAGPSDAQQAQHPTKRQVRIANAGRGIPVPGGDQHLGMGCLSSAGELVDQRRLVAAGFPGHEHHAPPAG